MHVLSSLLAAVALCASSAVAAGITQRSTTPGTASIENVTCGTNTYSRQQVDQATAEGCRLYQEGEQLGSSKYPHKFNNYEGLVFATSGPYQEFPILTSKNYTGRSPGADRIVFDPNYESSQCVFVGAMTHTDAPTRNGFVVCDIAVAASQPSGSPNNSAPAPSPTDPDSGGSHMPAWDMGSLWLVIIQMAVQVLV